MVMPNDRENQTKRLQRSTNTLSQDRMLTNELPLCGRERSGLQQNRIRHSDLSNVMHNASATQSGDLLGRKAQVLTQDCGVFGQAFTVAVSVRIFAFNAASQREQH